MTRNPYRLEKILTPLVYDVALEPDLENFTFEARETFTCDLLRRVSKITLHAADLKIHSAELFHPAFKNKALQARKISYNKKYETATFDFGQSIPKGKKIILKLSYQGALNDKMHGFYRTSYEVHGQKRWGAATQFEATDARRAFVCVDEPAAKARFQASLTVPTHLTALSNMPVIEETLDPRSDKKTLRYDTTPTMSTYLLCFVVAELESVETKDKNGVTIRVWTTPGKKEQGQFALEVASHALPYFAEWFDIPYALPKLDMVALPDFSSGAMENWGLVTYRETALLVDPVNSSAQSKQRVAEVIDHELAHQWFGNLVTMEWWTDLWLNEGFASYMGPKAVNDRFPEWKLWDQYVATELLTALHDDALKNSHPIEIPVKNPHEIREIFDHITYNKGSAVNRMLEHYLGEEKFREGLRRYLKKYAYQNARTVDLWAVLEKVSKQPVRRMMADFTKQEGFPVVQADIIRKNGKDILEVSQKRFIFDGSPDRQKLTWKVPLTLSSFDSGKTRAFLLSGKKTSLDLGMRVGGWIKLNPGETGFYRVQYSKKMLLSLLEAVEKQAFSVADALGILDDAFSFVRAGHVRSTEILEILPRFSGWNDYNLWLSLSGVLGSVESLLDDENYRKAFHGFGQKCFQRVWHATTWEVKKDDSHSDLLRRSLVISRLGHFGQSAVIDEANKRFAGYCSGGTLDPNLRGAVYGVVAEIGSGETWSQFKKLYRQTDLQEEKVRILRALTRFQEPRLISEILDFSLSSDVRPQDTYAILAGFGGNNKAREMNWKFIRTHWKKITALYKSGSVGLLGHILEGATAGFTEKKNLHEVEGFFRKNPIEGTERTRKQSLELIHSNIAWKARDKNDLIQWLGSRIS